MSTDDIKAAAERVRRVASQCSQVLVYLSGDEKLNHSPVDRVRMANARYYCDLLTLADAYLTEHQADDDEPITDKWLSTMYDAIAIEGITFGVLAMNTIDSSRTKLMVTMTRGQVRSLLRAMGVTL